MDNVLICQYIHPHEKSIFVPWFSLHEDMMWLKTRHSQIGYSSVFPPVHPSSNAPFRWVAICKICLSVAESCLCSYDYTAQLLLQIRVNDGNETFIPFSFITF